MKIFTKLVLGFFIFTAQTFAGDLRNADSVKYDYKVSCGGSTTSTSISSNTTQTGAAKKGCTLEGSWGKVKLEGDKGAEIKSGKLTEKK